MHVSPGEESSLLKTTTMKVRFPQKCCSCCSVVAYLKTVTNLPVFRCFGILLLKTPPLVHVTGGVVVSIGSVSQMRCVGVYSLAEAKLLCCVPSLETRCCGAFCKCGSQRGQALSDSLKWTCAHGADCDLDSSHTYPVPHKSKQTGMAKTRLGKEESAAAWTSCWFLIV